MVGIERECENGVEIMAIASLAKILVSSSLREGGNERVPLAAEPQGKQGPPTHHNRSQAKGVEEELPH